VLPMSAIKFSDPVMFGVDMVADNFSLHVSIIPRAQILFPNGWRTMTAAAAGRRAGVRSLFAMGPVSQTVIKPPAVWGQHNVARALRYSLAKTTVCALTI
jgi:hypothetical protein